MLEEVLLNMTKLDSSYLDLLNYTRMKRPQLEF